jgi:hypothetical protein
MKSIKKFSRFWFVFALLLVMLFLVGCDKNTKQHIDKGYKPGTGGDRVTRVSDFAHMGGYTVIEKHTDDNYRFFMEIVKTEDYNEMKRTGKGLFALGKKSRTVFATDALYHSVSVGESIPAMAEKKE